MIIRTLCLIAVVLLSDQIHAGTLTLNFSQPQDQVQNRRGQEVADPISPGISIGPHYNIDDTFEFAPELGYIYNTVQTKDHYSGKYKMQTFYLLYDFLYPLDDARTLKLRFGMGTFLKQISGSGGSVTVPNGSGTSTAYKPGAQKSAFTSSLNLGIEWFFTEGDIASFFQRYRLFSEIFVFEPIYSRKRLLTLQIGIGANF